MLFIMENLQYSKEDQTLESHHASGFIFMYLDDKPVQKVSFSHSVHIKFVFLTSPPHQNNVKEEYVNCKTEPCSPLNIWSPDCDSIALEDDDNEYKDMQKGNDILLSKSLKEEVYSDSDYENYSLNLKKEIVETLKGEHDVCDKEQVSSSDTTVSSTDSVAGSICVSSSNSTANGSDGKVGLDCKLCQKWFASIRENENTLEIQIAKLNVYYVTNFFPSKGDLFTHQYSSYNLSFLDSQFPEFNLNTDTQRSDDEEKVVCPICGIVTAFNHFKYHHVYSHFHELSYKCCLCGDATKTATQLEMHCRNHITKHSATSHAADVALLTNNAGKMCTSGNKKLVSKLLDNSKKLKNIATKTKKKTMNSNDQELISKTGLNEQNTKIDEGAQLTADEVRDIVYTNQEGYKTYQCPYCKKSFSSRTLFHSHKETPSLNLKCQSCDAVLPSQAGMIIHEYEAHKNVNTAAEKDTLSGPDTEEKDRDKLLSNALRPKCKQFVPCPVCFVPVTRLVLHEHVMRKHTQEKPYQCCVCGLPCPGSHQYRDHCNTHIGQSKKGFFQCSSCPENFASRSEFYKHVMVHKTVCHFCNVDFKLTCLLDAHYNTEHKDQLLKCKQCGKRLPTERKLKLHEKHHRFNFRRPCSKCGAMVIVLDKHMERYHEESNPELHCSICPKTFKQQRDLKKHLTSHTIINSGEKFPCPKCPKTFNCHNYLRSHARVHLNLKLHECPVCLKQFRKKLNLRTHMRLHSVHQLFRCDICKEGFNFKISLINHQKSKH